MRSKRVIILFLTIGVIVYFAYQQMATNNTNISNTTIKQIDTSAVNEVKKGLDLATKKNTLNYRVFITHREIVTIGDSLTAGQGDEENNGGYVGILENLMNTDTQVANFHNFGVSGNRTDQLLNRLTNQDIIDKIQHANTVLITIGANDIMQIFRENLINLRFENFSDGEDDYTIRLREIFIRLREINPDASIYLIGFYNPFAAVFPDIPELETIIDTWNNIGLEVTEQFDNTYYIPTKDLFETDTADFLSSDNFHINHLGYERMATRILEHLIDREGDIYEQIEVKEE